MKASVQLNLEECYWEDVPHKIMRFASRMDGIDFCRNLSQFHNAEVRFCVMGDDMPDDYDISTLSATYISSE